MVDVWSKDQRIHQDGNFHKSLGRYLQRRSLNSCLVRLACLLGRKMMEDKIALMETLDALSEDHQAIKIPTGTGRFLPQGAKRVHCGSGKQNTARGGGRETIKEEERS